jgi:hypothetical protein
MCLATRKRLPPPHDHNAEQQEQAVVASQPAVVQ